MTGSVTYPPRTTLASQAVFISACEALTWIGWGEARTVDRIQQDGFAAVRRWGTSNLGLMLAALTARAAPEPYCMVLDRELVAARGITSRHVRMVRARARRSSGALLSYSDLVNNLTAEIEQNRRNEELLTAATVDLLDAMRAETITGYGQQRKSDGSENQGAPHSAIPIEVLIHPLVTLGSRNQVTIDNEVDFSAWRERKALTFDDVRFRRSDILRLWPTQTSVEVPSGLPPELAGDPKAVQAFTVMLRLSESGPRKRDGLAAEVNARTTYPVRKARDLYQYLPSELRNPARKRPQ